MPPESLLIPVIVDSVKRYPSFDMSRCNYLSIDLDTPRPGWAIQIRQFVVPFLMLRLGGILFEPIGGGLFDSPQKIAELFVYLEGEGTLLVDMEDVWLPNFVLRRGDARVGDVFRVSSQLFESALLFREGRLRVRDFIERCERDLENVRYSEGETAAFLKWREMEILAAREQYPKSDALAFRSSERSGGLERL